MGASLEVETGDITEYATDAVVNAANNDLGPGSGVNGALQRAAGPELLEAMQAQGGCPTGEARITPGFELPADYVIHTVGPVWRGGEDGEPDLLAAAYASSLDLATDHELESIAFPALSTGVFGYPPARAAEVAAQTVAGWIDQRKEETSVKTIVFVCFDDETRDIYAAAVAAAQSV